MQIAILEYFITNSPFHREYKIRPVEWLTSVVRKVTVKINIAYNNIGQNRRNF